MLETSEVIYVDKTLLHSNAEINWLLEGKRTEMDCILRAGLKQIGEPDAEGHYRFTYAMTFNTFIDHPMSSGKEFILIFHYVNLYPIQGLCLTSWASVDEIDQIRKIVQYRKQH